MKQFKTEQEKFWASSEWGENYIKRNGEDMIQNNINFFSSIFEKCIDVNSCIEFGSNIGLNLHAINKLSNDLSLSAIEINEQAVAKLNTLNFLDEVFHESILEFENNKTWDFVFIKGVLIHISPEYLNDVYETLYSCSNKYILIAEYYNPSPVMIKYRGHENKLFKRDFAGEMLDKYDDLELMDYKFIYHRDNNFPQDDITWFLLKKKGK